MFPTNPNMPIDTRNKNIVSLVEDFIGVKTNTLLVSPVPFVAELVAGRLEDRFIPL